MLARLRGMLRPRRGLLVVAAIIAGATTASASWHLPGGGAGLAQASVDFHAPIVTGETIAPQGMTAAGGAVAPGGGFVVYANVVDVGVSGIAWVRTNVSNLATGATSVALSPCSSSCTIAGTTYGWSSAVQTANAGLAQGTQSYGVWAQDNAGNLGVTNSRNATVDSTKPSVTAAVVAMAAPATAAYVRASGTYYVYAKASDAGAPASGIVAVTADVGAITAGQIAVALPACTSSCTAGGVTYGYKSAALTTGSGIADGSKAFTVTATDAAANAASSSYTATSDSTAPAVSGAVVVNSSPSDAGFAKPGGNYIVYANASDAGGFGTVTADVSAITAGQTALALSVCSTGCTQGGVTYAYKSATKAADAGAAPGTAAFTVTATDKAANATVGHYSATVDAAGPTVSGIAIANTTTSAVGLLKKSGAYIVYANVSDPSGVSSVKANVSALTSGQTALTLAACSSACSVGGVTYGYKSASKTAGSSLVAGSVSYTVTATDGVGNTTTPTGTVTVDNTAPTIAGQTLATTTTVVPGYLSQGRTYTAFVNASDGNGIFSVSANVKNVTSGATAVAVPACGAGCTAGPTAYGYKSAPQTANAVLGAGSKSYTITVTDQAGNTATASPSVTVDNTAPTVAITFPTSAYAGGWLAGCSTASTADICGTAGDATSGVASVQLSLRQAASPNDYWNPVGSLFDSSTEVLMGSTLALPSWTFPAAAAWFTTSSPYTIRAVATDGAANTQTTSTTFTFSP
jgi:large repetitive protein